MVLSYIEVSWNVTKITSLACKCAFCRPKHVKRRPNGMEFWRSCWNPQMKHTNGESSKSRWKNGVFCLVIMVTLRVTVIKMSKIISAGSKKPVTVWGKYLSKIFKYSFLHFNTFEIQFLCSVKWTFTCQKSHFKPDNIDILFSE